MVTLISFVRLLVCFEYIDNILNITFLELFYDLLTRVKYVAWYLKGVVNFLNVLPFIALIEGYEFKQHIYSVVAEPLISPLFFIRYCPHSSRIWNVLNVNLTLPNCWVVRGTQRQFSENICSEDDLRSIIFGTFVLKFLACLLLLRFSNSKKWYNCPFLTDFTLKVTRPSFF